MTKHETRTIREKPPKQTDELSQLVWRIRLLGVSVVAFLIVIVAITSALLLDDDFIEDNTALIYVFVFVVIGCGLALVALITLLYRGFEQASSKQSKQGELLASTLRRSEQLQFAAKVARDATAEANPQAVLQRAVDMVNHNFDFYHVAIFMVETFPDGEYAVARAVSGDSTSQHMILGESKFPVESTSIIAHVVRSGQPYAVADVHTDPYYMPVPTLPHTRSELAVPLCADGQSIGVLDVQSVDEGAFNQDDVEIMLAIADLLAVAIDKAALHEQIRRYALGLEEKVIERTQELAHEQAQLQAVLDSMKEGVIYYEGSTLAYVNQAFQDSLGYSADEFTSFLPMLSSGGKTREEALVIFKAAMVEVNRNGHWQVEMPLCRKDKSEFMASLTVVQVNHFDDPQHDGVVTIVRDISQEKALEEQKTRFVANASHELRTPLANLKTRLYLLRKQPERFDEHYRIIELVMGQMQRLVDDLLDQSRFERNVISLEPSIMPIQRVVGQVTDMLQIQATEKAITLTSEFPPDDLRVYIDHDRMSQVLINLISNAINYNHQGGHVHVRIHSPDKLHVEVAISDDGIGIDPALLDDVFKPFFRGNNVDSVGTGLGLNIAMQIVELHNGQILTRSELNRGTTFTVQLPLHNDETASLRA